MIVTPKEDYQKLTKGSSKKIKLQCNECGNITETTYSNYFNSQKRRNNDLITLCKRCNGIEQGNKNKGRSCIHKGKSRPHLSGNKSSSWSGGRWISSDGYWMVYLGNHNKKNKWKNYRKEHLIIAEEKLGRKLRKGEVVHHIDCDKLNNSPDNLDILNNEKEHRVSHKSLDQIAIDLLQSGKIDYKNGLYSLKEK